MNATTGHEDYQARWEAFMLSPQQYGIRASNKSHSCRMQKACCAISGEVESQVSGSGPIGARAAMAACMGTECNTVADTLSRLTVERVSRKVEYGKCSSCCAKRQCLASLLHGDRRATRPDARGSSPCLQDHTPVRQHVDPLSLDGTSITPLQGRAVGRPLGTRGPGSHGLSWPHILDFAAL